MIRHPARPAADLGEAPPERIEVVEVLLCELELRRPLRTARGTVSTRPTVLVRVETDAAEGWGECPALPEPTYSEEYAEGAFDVLVRHLVPRMLDPEPLGGGQGWAVDSRAVDSRAVDSRALDSRAVDSRALDSRALDSRGVNSGNAAWPVTSGTGISGQRVRRIRLGTAGEPDRARRASAFVSRRLADVRGHPMARFGLETALVDAALRAESRTLASSVGATATGVDAGATVGIERDPGRVVAAVEEALGAGIGRVKLKIAPGSDLATLEAVRRRWPDGVFTADANGSYRIRDESHRLALQRIDRYGLAAIEQPLAPEDLDGQVELVRLLRTPVLADESVTSPAAAASLLRAGACDALSIKPARLGGIYAAVATHDLAVALGAPLAVGGMIESGIGRAVAVAIGALPGFTFPGDLGPSERTFVADVTDPFVVVAGRLPVPSGAGIGRCPLADALGKVVRRRKAFSPGAGARG